MILAPVVMVLDKFGVDWQDVFDQDRLNPCMGTKCFKVSSRTCPEVGAFEDMFTSNVRNDPRHFHLDASRKELNHVSAYQLALHLPESVPRPL